MHIINNIALISINETVFVQMISFLIFLFLINRIMFRPLHNVIHEREEYIDSITESIETSKNQLTQMNEQIRAQELTAIKEAKQHKKNLEEDGIRQANTLMEASRKEIQGIKMESQQFINRQISKARSEIRQESEKLAILIMEKVLDRRLAK